MVKPEVPLLSFELLEAFRGRLVEQGAPVVGLLARGLDRDELRAALSDIELEPSAEAQVWWGWSRGVPLEAVRQPGSRALGPGMDYLEPEETAVILRQLRELAVPLAEDAADFATGTPRATPGWWWQPGWLPITTNGAGTTIACDCSVPEGEPSPMYAVNWGVRENFYEPSAASFGQMVTWWIEALDDGSWRYDREAGRWDYNWELVEPERQLGGLV